MGVVNPLVVVSGRVAELDADDPITPDSEWGEHELWSYDWTAASTVSYTNGQTATHNGLSFLAQVPSGATVGITNGTGLTVSRTTTGEAAFYLQGGSSGWWAALGLSNRRFMAGGLAFMVQVTYTISAAGAYGYTGLNGAYPAYWMSCLRGRSIYGTANDAVGGIGAGLAYAGIDVTQYSIAAANTVDVLCVHMLDSFRMNILCGTYAGGWPTVDSMTQVGCERFGMNGLQASRAHPPDPGNMDWLMLFAGGANASTFVAKKSRIVEVTA